MVTVARLPGIVIRCGDTLVLLHLMFAQNGNSSMASVFEPWQDWNMRQKPGLSRDGKQVAPRLNGQPSASKCLQTCSQSCL
jgi:hypothetical protein